MSAIPHSSRASLVARSIACRCTGGANELAQRIGAGQTGFPAQRDVLGNRQGVAELHALERAAESVASACRRAQPCDVFAVKPNLAADATVQAAAGVEGRRLTGAVRTDEPGDAAQRCREGEVVDGDGGRRTGR